MVDFVMKLSFKNFSKFPKKYSEISLKEQKIPNFSFTFATSKNTGEANLVLKTNYLFLLRLLEALTQSEFFCHQFMMKLELNSQISVISGHQLL
jgi:hypothetical protein